MNTRSYVVRMLIPAIALAVLLVCQPQASAQDAGVGAGAMSQPLLAQTKVCPGRYYFITYFCDCGGACCGDFEYLCHNNCGQYPSYEQMPSECNSYSVGTPEYLQPEAGLSPATGPFARR